MIRKYPKNSSPYVWRGTLYEREAQFAEALEVYRKAYLLQPLLNDINGLQHNLYLSLLVRQGHQEELFAYYDSALQDGYVNDYHKKLISVSKVTALLHFGEYEQALIEYQRLLKKAPSKDIFFNMGVCHEMLGNDQESMKCYEEYFGYDFILSSAKCEYKSHIEIDARALLIDEKSSDNYWDFICSLAYEDKTKSFFSVFPGFSSEFPHSDYSFAYPLSSSVTIAAEYPVKIECIDELLEKAETPTQWVRLGLYLNTLIPKSYNVLGSREIKSLVADETKKLYASSLQCIEKAAELAPQYGWLNFLATILNERCNGALLDEANEKLLESAKRAITAKIPSSAAYDYLAQMYYQRKEQFLESYDGDLEHRREMSLSARKNIHGDRPYEAIALLEEAVQHYPNSARSLQNLVRLYEYVGDYQKVYDGYSRLAELMPEHNKYQMYRLVNPL